MKPEELDEFLRDSKQCSKIDLRMYVARLVIEVRRLDDIARREREIKRMQAAYDELEESARAFTMPRYTGLIGGTNHIEQSRLVVALSILEALKKR